MAVIEFLEDIFDYQANDVDFIIIIIDRNNPLSRQRSQFSSSIGYANIWTGYMYLSEPLCGMIKVSMFLRGKWISLQFRKRVTN